MRSLIAILFASLVLPASAQADAVDELMAAQMKAQKIPGASVLVLRGGKVIKKSAYGLASIELKTPADPDGLYESGSIGKVFTTTATMLLVEEGKIDPEASVRKYLDQAPEAWDKVKIKNLLSNTSGITDCVLVPGLGLVDSWTKEVWWDKMSKLPLEFQPGDQFSYSSSNFLLLAEIVSKLSGKTFSDFLTERVIKPAGLTHTFFASSLEIMPKRASGYYNNEGVLINKFNIPSEELLLGAGGLIQDTTDLAKFEEALRTGKILKPETVKKTQTPFRLNGGRNGSYGFGWFIRKLYGNTIVSHGGNTTGYAASVSRFMEHDLTVVVMCNLYNVLGDELARNIAEKYIPSLNSKNLKEQSDPDTKRTEMVLGVVKSLASGQAPVDGLDPAYKARLDTPRGKMSLGSLAPLREVDKLSFLMDEDSDPDRTLRYRAKVGKKVFLIAVVLTKDSKVFSVSAREEL